MVANWLMHWRIGMFGPAWFRVMRKAWGMYRAGEPIVHWVDVKDLCQRLTDAETENAALRHDLERCMARELVLLNSPQADASADEKQ